MDSYFACSQGHRWRRLPPEGSPNLCPVCGAASLPPSGPDSPDPSTTRHTLLPGYELLGQAGIGGMGIVFRARQQASGRVVAVKMLRDDDQSIPDAPLRFQREIRCLANLDHPNVLKVYESGARDGVAYLIMEYLEGGSLVKRLNGSPMPPRDAARLLATLAAAVHYLHGRGLVHRNLKPHNVLFAADGTPKLIDFGLARLGKDDAPAGEGVVVGTPSYMAPEQAAGRSAAIGPATDVYGLGAVLYECLTGKPPFAGASVMETLKRVGSWEPVPPHSLNKQADREIEGVCLRCLHKEPRDRYASAQEVAEDLGRYLDGQPVRGRRTGFWQRLFGRE
jgi:serine/threonine-protein kinase